MSNLYARAAGLLEANLGDELVGLDPESGLCFGFNDVATSIWKLLAKPSSFEEVWDALVAEYDVEPAECSAQLARLLDELIERGLVKTLA